MKYVKLGNVCGKKVKREVTFINVRHPVERMKKWKFLLSNDVVFANMTQFERKAKKLAEKNIECALYMREMNGYILVDGEAGFVRGKKNHILLNVNLKDPNRIATLHTHPTKRTFSAFHETMHGDTLFMEEAPLDIVYIVPLRKYCVLVSPPGNTLPLIDFYSLDDVISLKLGLFPKILSKKNQTVKFVNMCLGVWKWHDVYNYAFSCLAEMFGYRYVEVSDHRRLGRMIRCLANSAGWDSKKIGKKKKAEKLTMQNPVFRLQDSVTSIEAFVKRWQMRDELDKQKTIIG